MCIARLLQVLSDVCTQQQLHLSASREPGTMEALAPQRELWF